jgi:uncharacterized phage infection (PIP) family protein YhgE
MEKIMKPIVNPWIVYFAHLFSNIQMLFTILLLASVSVLVISFISEFDFINSDKIGKFIKILVIIISVSGLVLTFIPDKETVYTMIVLDQLTEDNINSIGKTGKDVIDYVTDKIEALEEKDNE